MLGQMTVGIYGARVGANRALRSWKRHPHVAEDVLERYARLTRATRQVQAQGPISPSEHFVINFCASFRFSRSRLARYEELLAHCAVRPL
jgi:hypothetical protein